MSFINIVHTGKSDSGKTDQWAVMNRDGSTPLGYIGWFPAWRKYTLITIPQVVFDEACLTEIGTFLKTETEKHKHAVRQR